MNRKGDLPITILVIGVLAVCVLALMSFALNDLKDRERTFIGLEKVQEVNINAEKGLVKQDCDLGKCYKAENIDKALFPWEKDIILFKVEYYPK